MAVRAAAGRLTRTGTTGIPARGGDFTLAFWFRQHTSTNGQYNCLVLFGGSTTAFDADTWALYSRDGGTNTLECDIWTGTGPTENDAESTLTISTWYHCVITRSGNTWTVYIDGTQHNTGTFSPTNANIDVFIVGGAPSGDIAATDFLGMKWWNAVLSANEIANERRTLQPKRYANLQAWWPMHQQTLAGAQVDLGPNKWDFSTAGTAPTINNTGGWPPVGWGGQVLRPLRQAAGGGGSDTPITVDPPGLLTLTPRVITFGTSLAVQKGTLALTPRNVALNTSMAVQRTSLTLTPRDIPFQVTTPWTPGLLQFTGRNIGLHTSMAVQKGTLTLTPRVINLIDSADQSFTIPVDPSVLTLTGRNVALNTNLAIQKGSLILTPRVIDLIDSGDTNFSINVDPASLVLTGRNIGLHIGMPVVKSSLALVGSQIAFNIGHTFTKGSLVLTPRDIGLIAEADQIITVEPGHLILTGREIQLLVSGLDTEDTIDGSPSYVINTAYGSVLLYHNGSRRFFTLTRV